MSSTNSNSSIGSAKIKVTPEELSTKADEVQLKINSMKNLFDSMKTVMKNTNTYWEGEAGEAHRKTYSECEPVVEEIFLRLSEHVTDLNAMAGVYQAAEKQTEELAEALPIDLIS